MNISHEYIKLICLMTLLISGCDRQAPQSDMKNHVSTCQHGIATIPWAKQMDDHFGRAQVDHFITHYGSTRQPLPWNSQVHFGGRFILSMQVPVNVDYTTNQVSIAGAPEFYLHAVDTVEQLPDGRHSSSYASDLQRVFDEAKWKQLVNHQFKLEALGIPTDEQRSVDGFDGFVNAARQPRQLIP